jgi:hypothetical protein
MGHLSAHPLDPQHREAVVADANWMIDAEVRRAPGLSGLAIRSAYRPMSGVRPGLVAGAVEGLLCPLADQLDPFHHLLAGKPPGRVFADVRTSVADALLSISDDRAERTTYPTLRRAYRQVRGSARRHVQSAGPALADLITAHARGPDAQ